MWHRLNLESVFPVLFPKRHLKPKVIVRTCGFYGNLNTGCCRRELILVLATRSIFNVEHNPTLLNADQFWIWRILADRFPRMRHSDACSPVRFITGSLVRRDVETCSNGSLFVFFIKEGFEPSVSHILLISHTSSPVPRPSHRPSAPSSHH